MMDLMILVAVFVAILALAYFTYRNIVGLDSRLRKIEDVLKNAEVVAAPAHEHSETHHEDSHEENTRIPGWGGEGPPVNVERMPASNNQDEREVQVIGLPEDDGDDADNEHSSTDDESDLDSTNAAIVDSTSAEAGDAREGDVDEGDVDEGDVDEGDVDEGDASRDARDGNEENRREKSKYSSLRVNELRELLRKADVPFPNGAKKALLVSLLETNNVELSG